MKTHEIIKGLVSKDSLARQKAQEAFNKEMGVISEIIDKTTPEMVEEVYKDLAELLNKHNIAITLSDSDKIEIMRNF